MEDLKDLRKMVAANLRSVTQSCKGGVPFESLEKDYRDLLGVSIPYRDLGYSSLEAMIRAMPDVVKLHKNAYGKSIVMAVADEATAHIASLIARQKSAVKKPSTRTRRPLRVRRAPTATERPTSIRLFNKGTRAPPPYLEVDFQTHSKSNSRDDHIQETTKSAPLREQVQSQRAKAAPTFGPKYEVPPRFLRKQERPLSSLENNSTEDRFSTVTSDSFNCNSRQVISAGSQDDTYFAPPLIRRSERTSYATEQTSYAPKRTSYAPERTSYAPERTSYAPERTSYAPERTSYAREQATYATEPESMVDVIESYAKSKNITAYYRTLPFEDAYVASLVLGGKRYHCDVSSGDESSAKENCAAVAVGRLKLRGSAREFIERYARQNKLKCSYQTSPIGQKKKSFVSVLTLGEERYRNYPDVAPTSDEAEEAAAEKARQAICKQEGSQKLLPVADVHDPRCLDVMLNRIDEMVAEKPKGIWNTVIPTEYETKFEERLPDDWFALVKEYCSFYFEKVDDNRIILYPSPASGRASPTSTSSNQDDDSSFEDLERNPYQLSVQIPVLSFPKTNPFDVFVCNVQNAECVAVRFLDYAEGFEELSEEMKIFYDQNRCPVNIVSKEKPYAAFIYGLWHRVLIDEIKGDMIVCQLMDEGDTVKINASNLQEIDPRFLELAFQAYTFKLAELDSYSMFIKPETLQYYLLGKTLVAKVDSTGTSIILYDTSTEDDINLNRIIFEKTVAESLNYNLPACNFSDVAYLTHVSPCGTIYLTFNSPSTTNLLLEELYRITPTCEEHAKLGCVLSKSCIYAARYDYDSIWYRAIILDSAPERDEVEVLYVDYGNTNWVSVSSICHLKPVSEYLAELPFQAVRCKLSELPPPNRYWSDKAIQKLVEIAPLDKELIVRVQKEGTKKELPEISLFARNEQSQIVSINQTLAFDEQLFSQVPSEKRDRLPSWTTEFLPEFNKKEYTPPASSPYRVHNLEECKALSEVESTTTEQGNLSNFIPDVAVSAEQQLAKKFGNWSITYPTVANECDNEEEQFPPLCPPDVPEEKSFFDVFVTMAASPFNFMCQPLKSSKDLDQLFSEMQSFYSNEENLCEMHSVLVKKGEFFAGKHFDGSWYRVRKQTIVSEDPLEVSVYYVDYGDMCILPLPNLQPLFKQFKSLPCQCMKASLKGVRPNGHDWDPMECYEFKKMVEEKQFVSIVESRHLKVEDHLTVYSLELMLIDVSDPKVDVLIHEELIKNKIAQST